MWCFSHNWPALFFLPFANPYGSFFAFVVGLILRFGGGEPTLELEPFIYYPWYDEENGQIFPYKTFSMLVSLVVIVTVSYLFKVLFDKGILPAKLDITGKVVTNVDITDPEYMSTNTLVYSDEIKQTKKEILEEYFPVDPGEQSIELTKF